MEKEILHCYMRVSSDGQVRKDNSLPSQKKAAELKAEQLGMQLQLHQEAGESANEDTLDNRPVLKHLLDLCEDEIVKHVFVTEFDRLTRSPKTEIEIKQTFIKKKVLLHTTGQTFDFNDAEDDFISSLLALVNRREINIKVKRTIRTLLESAKKGKVGGGVTIAYGFKKEGEHKMMVIDEEERKIIERIFQMSLDNIGSKTIAQQLNSEGIPTRGRKTFKNGLTVKNKYNGRETHKAQEELIWQAGTIISMIKNPIYKGERMYKGSLLDKPMIIKVPAIIPPSMWEAVQKNLTKNKAYAGGNEKKHFYLLKGLIRCAKCGRNFYGVTNNNKRMRVYMCSGKREIGCSSKSINIEKMNNLVWDAVGGSKHLLDNLKAELNGNTKTTSQKTELLQKQLKSLDAKLKAMDVKENNLIDLRLSGVISQEKLVVKAKELKDEQTSIQGDKDAVSKEIEFIVRKENVGVLSVEFFKMVAGLAKVSDSDKQTLLQMLVKEITVDYDEQKQQHLIKIEVHVPNTEKPKEIWFAKDGRSNISFEDEKIARNFFDFADRSLKFHNQAMKVRKNRKPERRTEGIFVANGGKAISSEIV